MPQLRVGFAPWLAGLLLAAAALNLFVFLLTQAGLQLMLTAVLGVVGFLQLLGTWLTVDGGRIELKNALGMTLKTLHFASPHDLSLDGRTLWVQTVDGERKKVSGLAANGTHWRALGEAIAQAQTAAPRPSASSGG